MLQFLYDCTKNFDNGTGSTASKCIGFIIEAIYVAALFGISLFAAYIFS